LTLLLRNNTLVACSKSEFDVQFISRIIKDRRPSTGRSPRWHS